MIGRDAHVRPADRRAAAHGHPDRHPAGMIGGYVIMVLLALIYLIPLMFVLFVSLMSSRQFALNAASFPDPIMWSNYPDAWVHGLLQHLLRQHVDLHVAIVFGTLHHRDAGRLPDRAEPRALAATASTCCSSPGILLPAGIIPQFFVMQQLGLYDTRLGYILLWLSRVALPIFILTGFIKGIPSELDDAAAIDGCAYIRYIFQIVMPLMQPALERGRADRRDPGLERHHRSGDLPAVATRSSRSRPGCSSSSPSTPRN